MATLLDAQQVDALSKLPTLDELRAQLAGLVITPAQGVVNVLHQATGGVVNVLQAYLDKQEESAWRRRMNRSARLCHRRREFKHSHT